MLRREEQFDAPLRFSRSGCVPIWSLLPHWRRKCPMATGARHREEFGMLLALFLVLLVLWALGFFAFHVAGGLIHLLLIVALISLVMHLFRSNTA